MAEQIVAEATRVLLFDINVMDETGSILASTDLSRVGSLHRGAQIALSNGSDLEVDKAMAKRIPKVKPGVNMPIFVDGEVWGAIGITGAPEEVRQYGKLLQVLAQMILEREALTTELRRNQRHREDLVLHLINAQGSFSATELENMANRFGVDFSAFWFVLVCDFLHPKTVLNEALEDIARAQWKLSQHIPQCLSARTSHSELIILDQISISATDHCMAEIARERLFSITNLIDSSGKLPLTVSIGVGLSGITAFNHSWKSALATMQAGIARRSNLRERCFSFYEHRLFSALSTWAGTWQATEVMRPLEILKAQDRARIELLPTLKAWYRHGGQPNKTAEELRIHRNTLDKRLKRVNELCRINLSSTEDYVSMYIALQLDAP
ncbi:sugar diacid recognition domain-containing protein [Collimonas arenae]|uniref:sugar diacid recognition domain-containing protein n=1 Tax=Collimonas arenae TaxID=279058 RepID=UPI0013E289CD|nr:sugar diacid recognition domain-containing protein [Collimonas arenae]